MKVNASKLLVIHISQHVEGIFPDLSFVKVRNYLGVFTCVSQRQRIRCVWRSVYYKLDFFLGH